MSQENQLGFCKTNHTVLPKIQMARFDGIQLILKNGFSKRERVAVTMQSRAMVNFIEWRLATYGFESEFTKLNIGVSKTPVSGELIRYKEPKRFIEILIQMDPGEFLEPMAKFHEVCASMVRAGLRAALHHVDLPIDEASKAIEEFFSLGCVNQWIHEDKTWRRVAVRSVIHCELRTDAFVLTQRVYKSDKLMGEAMIARTKPREWLFYLLLGKLTLKDSRILYRAKNSHISCYDLTTGEFEISDDNINEPFVLEMLQVEAAE